MKRVNHSRKDPPLRWITSPHPWNQGEGSSQRPPCLMAVMRCASSPIPEFFSGMGSDLSNVDPGP